PGGLHVHLHRARNVAPEGNRTKRSTEPPPAASSDSSSGLEGRRSESSIVVRMQRSRTHWVQTRPTTEVSRYVRQARLQGLIENRCKNRVVPTGRMADGAEPPALHERQRFEQVESADVVPDGLHRAALVAERFEIRIVVGQERIGRRQADVAAPGEFDAIFVV